MQLTLTSSSQSFCVAVPSASVCCHIWLGFLYGNKESLEQLRDPEVSPFLGDKKILCWMVVEMFPQIQVLGPDWQLVGIWLWSYLWVNFFLKSYCDGITGRWQEAGSWSLRVCSGALCSLLWCLPVAPLCMLSRMRETASTVGQWSVPCQLYFNKTLIGQ